MRTGDERRLRVIWIYEYIMKVILGLGNPGKKYQLTRHNIGRLFLERYAQQLQLRWNKKRFSYAEVASSADGVQLVVAKTFMNLSGEAAREIVNAFNIEKTELMVIHDDMHFDFGEIRVKPSGGDGGHNGLYSVISCLDYDDFSRVRLGIGNAPEADERKDYVLSEFTAGEKHQLPSIFQRVQDVVTCWLQEGLEKTMTKYNARRVDE